MKKKVFLKRILHNDKWRYGIYYDFDTVINNVVRSIDSAAYSSSQKCWHVSCDEETLKSLLHSLKELADVDISSISLPSEKKKYVSTKPSMYGMSSGNKEGDEIPERLSGPVTIRKVTGKTEKREKYDPVTFTIDESRGMLVIRFTGRYDRDWIREMRSYGKLYYDDLRKEWSLRWSQITVDSLADYFMEEGIKVRVVKPELPEIIKLQRQASGTEVRSRVLGAEALKGVEQLNRYLNEIRYSPKTVEAYVSMLELFFKYLSHKNPSEITEGDISGFFHDFVFVNNYSASYQSQMVSAIKLFFSLNGNGNVNISNLGRPRTGRSLPKVFSKDEVIRILNSPSNLKHKLMLWIIYSCGLRRGEVTNIRLRDLDRDRKILNVIEAKGMIDRIVPVPEKVWLKIDEYIASYRPVIYLFEGQGGGRYSSESVYRIFKDALRKTGINKQVGVHSLRHSYATHLHENGLDIRYIQELLGHKDTRTTEIYTHVSRRNLVVVRSPIEDLDLN